MSDDHECPACGESFATLGGMRSHHAQVHGESIAGYETECGACGTTFTAPYSQTKYCSNECRAAGHRNGESVECATCGDSVYVTPARARDSATIFCSNECMGDSYSGENNPDYSRLTVQCWNCGEEHARRRSRVHQTKRHFCDYECQAEWTQWAGKDPNDPEPDRDLPRWAATDKTPPTSQAEYLALSLADDVVTEADDE